MNAARSRNARSFAALCAAGVAFFTSPHALSQGSTVTSPIELAREAERLKPGEWVWAPQIAPEGPLLVYVDLSAQLATIYRNGVRIGVSTVSSGKAGHETPTGVFSILQKDAHHRSSTYHNAPMPYQERLTWDGVALHAGGLPGFPESHGCIHLPLEFSRLLFETTHIGGTVIVSGKAGTPAVGSAGVLDPVNPTRHVPLTSSQDYRWQPELSPNGPVSIIVSVSDQRAVVFRNGVEIGRSRIRLSSTGSNTHVLSYASGPSPHWIAVTVPGHEGEATSAASDDPLTRAQMPEAFRDQLRQVMTPGATILITQAPVLPHTTGRSLTVIASDEPLS